MPFPRFLRSATATGGAQPIAVAGGPPPTNSAFTIQRQVQSNWCWAAVTASISDFYRASQAWTQCTVANVALGRQDCCTTGGSDPSKCNRPYYLEIALDVTGHLSRIETRGLSVSEIQSEITGGRPLGCRVEWFDGTGHFLAVTGCFTGASGDAYLDIADPIFLDSQILFRDFATLYQSGASWTHTYLTTGAAAGSGIVAANQSRQPRHPDAIGA